MKSAVMMYFNPSNAWPKDSHINFNMVITAPTDVLTHNSAKPSADTVLTTNLNTSYFKISVAVNDFVDRNTLSKMAYEMSSNLRAHRILVLVIMAPLIGSLDINNAHLFWTCQITSGAKW